MVVQEFASMIHSVREVHLRRTHVCVLEEKLKREGRGGEGEGRREGGRGEERGRGGKGREVKLREMHIPT